MQGDPTWNPRERHSSARWNLGILRWWQDHGWSATQDLAFDLAQSEIQRQAGAIDLIQGVSVVDAEFTPTSTMLIPILQDADPAPGWHWQGNIFLRVVDGGTERLIQDAWPIEMTPDEALAYYQARREDALSFR